ncbi:acyl-CoA dehydrogenase family protein, partial [Tabrizicola sp.]|uniref:acyl-CoA dehydrogenase family protein n=1 Tax=Tabrizicola sp. TaxID=2005166 RepID=UPI0035ADC56C
MDHHQPAAMTEETRLLRDLVAKFVERDLMPLEPAILKREATGGGYKLSEDEETHLLARCRELGLWGLDVPEEFGGANLPLLALAAAEEELARACVPFVIPPDSPNLHMMLQVASPYQRQKYLLPYASGEQRSAMAISEPGAGGDPAGMTTRAVKDGGQWVINGRKIWVSNVPRSDFIILMARTGDGKRQDGITAFLIDKGTPGFIIERAIPMIGGRTTYEL